jgi:hypothetical protein
MTGLFKGFDLSSKYAGAFSAVHSHWPLYDRPPKYEPQHQSSEDCTVSVLYFNTFPQPFQQLAPLPHVEYVTVGEVADKSNRGDHPGEAI